MFSDLANLFDQIEKCSSRLQRIQLLGNFFQVCNKDEIHMCAYLALGKLGPVYSAFNINVGEAVVIKSLSEATNLSLKELNKQGDILGDLGLVAAHNLKFVSANKSITYMFTKLKDLSRCNGKGSIAKKIDIIKLLLEKCNELEAKYLVRLLCGKLKIKIADVAIIDAIVEGFCSVEDPKKAKEIIKDAYDVCPDFEKILNVIVNENVDQLPIKCTISPGVPVQVMLAQQYENIEKIQTPFTCEYKYDGMRAQIHVDDGLFQIYSRNLENCTEKFADVKKYVENAFNCDVKNCIIDCEIVAYDKVNRKILSLQQLSTRKRKLDQNAVNVCIYAFDLMYLNDASLLKCPFQKRRQLLKQFFKQIDYEFMFVTSKDYKEADMNNVENMVVEATRNSCEGIMIKCLNEVYKRSKRWVKWKSDYTKGMFDTLDLVVIGAYHGNGQRAILYGGFLIACYDVENDEYQAICKIGSGFSNLDLETFSTSLKNLKIPQKRQDYCVHKSIKPDIWCDAKHVWEVKCAGLTVSPIYKAGYNKIDSNKGISLRFPRFVRVRDDKEPTEATTNDTIITMFKRQNE